MYGLEYVSDPKIHSLTSDERSCWLTLLCYASISNVEGEVMNMSEEKLMVLSGMDDGSPSFRSLSILKKLENLKMINILDGGIIEIVNWSKRQEKEAMSPADRNKRYLERKKNREQTGNILEDSFAEFWESYPRKASKQTAFKSWCKINPNEEIVQKILASIEKQSKSPQWQKDDGQFIPHPATWLNQERWNDETTIVRPKVGGGKFESVKSTKV